MKLRLTGFLSFAGLCCLVSTLPQKSISEQLEFPQENLPPGVSQEAPAFPLTKGRGYPHLFTRKTSALLSEALGMLHRVRDSKERHWLETFIHRLGGLAVDLERSTGHKSGLSQIAAAELGPLFTSAPQPNEVVPSLSVGAAPLAFEPKDDLIQQLHSQPHPMMMMKDEEAEPEEEISPMLKAANKLKPTLHSKEQTRKKFLGQLRAQAKQMFDSTDAKEFREPIKRQPLASVQSKEDEQRYSIPDPSDDFDTEEEGAATGELEDEDLAEANTGAPSLITSKSTIQLAHFLTGTPQDEKTMQESSLDQQLQGEKVYLSKDNHVHTQTINN